MQVQVADRNPQIIDVVDNNKNNNNEHNMDRIETTANCAWRKAHQYKTENYRRRCDIRISFAFSAYEMLFIQCAQPICNGVPYVRTYMCVYLIRRTTPTNHQARERERVSIWECPDKMFCARNTDSSSPELMLFGARLLYKIRSDLDTVYIYLHIYIYILLH